MTKKKVWILDDGNLIHEKELEIYEQNDVEYRVTTRASFKTDFEQFGRYTDAIVAQVGFHVQKGLIQSLDQCKIICTFGMGFNHVDLQAAKEQGIYVCNIPDYCKEEVADHAVAMSLALLRRLHVYNKDVKEGRWNPILPQPIHRFSSMTVGLLGFGQLAQLVSKRLQGFGMQIIAHDAFVPGEIFTKNNVESVSLDELFTRAQLLSVHLPFTEETCNIVNYDRMKLLPEDAIIVNTSRGGIVNEEDLVRVIQEGKVLAAGLDVLMDEPPEENNPLLQMDQVIITPHAAYYSKHAEEEMQVRTAENVIRRILQEETPLHIVNGVTKDTAKR